MSPPYYDDWVIRSDLAVAGFVEIQIERVTQPSRSASARDAATIARRGSMLRAAIETYDPSRLEEVTDSVTRKLLSEFGTGAIEGATQALLVTAERPVS
jgi:hypothetical protein